ncbi:unnamed protein product [Lampetra planeri]
METRQKALTRAPNKEVDGDTEPEAGAPFLGDGSAAAGSRSPGPSGSPPSSGWAIQSAHAQLADLLHAAASILDELTLGGAGAASGGPGQRVGAVPAENRGILAQNFDVILAEETSLPPGVLLPGATSLPPGVSPLS